MIRLRVLCVALLLAAPAAGEWLVLRDGTRLEIAGPWEVKGRQVVFTRPDGTLAAMRLADVDLESSTEVTNASRRAVAEPPPAASSERRSSILTLTDDDLRPGGAESEAQNEAAPDVDEADASEDESDTGSDDDTGSDIDAGGNLESAGVRLPDGSEEPVTVVSWRTQESSAIDGLEIVGSVRNQGRDVEADIQVQVRVSDEDGNLLVDTRGFLQRPSLAPGRSSTFRALLPGIYSLLEDPTFEVSSEGFTLGLVKETEAGENDDYAEPADDLDDYAEPGDDLDDYAEPADDLDDFVGELEDLEPVDELDDPGGGGY